MHNAVEAGISHIFINLPHPDENQDKGKFINLQFVFSVRIWRKRDFCMMTKIPSNEETYGIS